MKKLALIIISFLVLAGCADIKINPIITGTECKTKEACIKDLHLPNPASPAVVFVVDSYLYNSPVIAPIGTPGLFAPTYYGDVELCIAKALKDEYGDTAKIAFSSDGLTVPYTEIKTTDVVNHGVMFPVGGSHMWINYKLITAGQTYDLKADTPWKTRWNARTAVEHEYPWVCQILVKQVKDTLNKGKTAKAGN